MFKLTTRAVAQLWIEILYTPKELASNVLDIEHLLYMVEKSRGYILTNRAFSFERNEQMELGNRPPVQWHGRLNRAGHGRRYPPSWGSKNTHRVEISSTTWIPCQFSDHECYLSIDGESFFQSIHILFLKQVKFSCKFLVRFISYYYWHMELSSFRMRVGPTLSVHNLIM